MRKFAYEHIQLKKKNKKKKKKKKKKKTELFLTKIKRHEKKDKTATHFRNVHYTREELFIGMCCIKMKGGF